MVVQAEQLAKMHHAHKLEAGIVYVFLVRFSCTILQRVFCM